MKITPLTRIVSVLMAVLLLVSSLGFTIVEHTCEMKGKSHSARMGDGAVSSCCATAAASTNSLADTKHDSGVRENPCCKEKALLSSADVAVSPEAPLHQLVTPATVVALAKYLVFGDGYFTSDTHSAFHPYAGPPPASVSLYKALLCSWLI